MSSKHYFPDTAVNTLVPRHLKALCYANPSLALLEDHRVVLNTHHSRSQVSLISGGGSGHEPSWSGYVGDGLLSAVACGDIFASPSMRQVLAAIASVPSDQGTILLVTNYTGDRLHFGLAAERALESGLVRRCILLPATDDVSIGRSKCGKVGRRGLAGNSITMKILGAAAAKGYEFERLVEMGTAINDQLVSIGSALDHCHVPGRQSHEEIGDDVCVIGAGIHNEPGAQKVSPFPPIDDLMNQLLTLLCDQDDLERAFVKFNRKDETVLLVNNYGGLSNLELGALTHEALSQLDSKWNITPTLVYSGTFETSLNGPGFSITLFNITLAATASKTSVEELLNLLTAETKATSWPNALSITSTKVKRKDAPVLDLERQPEIAKEEDITIDPAILESAVKKACTAAIEAEPNLTKWDMIMGDGDCGESVKSVCEAILRIPSTNGSVLTLLQKMTIAVDNMGGTLGAILGILLAAFAHALRTRGRTDPDAQALESIDIFSASLVEAVEKLKNYTGARVGDRTVMDVLIPFSETLRESKSLEKAVRKSEEAAESTKTLKANFGRASYVGIEGEKGDEDDKVPDPGAWALMVAMRGLLEGIGGL